MSTSVIEAAQFSAASDLRPQAKTAPWHIYICVAATFFITFGLYWDISWHMTIGRDTFWTPAHLLLQLGAVLSALSSAYAIFRTTFGRDCAARAASVQVLGFRGPLGAFICAWGGAAMLVSAPFDNWWHNAYGLDVKIISPPHTLLAIGFDAIVLGTAVLIVREMNQAEGRFKQQLTYLLALVGGALLTLTMMGRLSYTPSNRMHSATFYLVVSIGPPFLLEAMARASGLRWGRTLVTCAYTISFLLGLWTFPLFPAEPKLGPVYQQVTHMVPLRFPILLVVPAAVLDWLWPKMQSWHRWRQAFVSGFVFVALLLAVHWPWADFLMSPASRNFICATGRIPYFISPAERLADSIFVSEASRLEFWLKLGFAWLAAIQCAASGISFGSWMRSVRR